MFAINGDVYADQLKENLHLPKIFHGNIWNCVRRGHAWKFAQVSEMWQLFLQRETYVGGWESTTTKYFDVQITDRFDQPHEPFWSRECSLKFGSGKFEGFSAVNSPGFFRSTCRLCFHLMDNLVIFWSFLIEHRDFPWPGWPGAPQLQVLESFATALTDGPALKRGTQLLFTLQQAGDGWQPWLQGKNWGS